ncbi:FHA domain-containing protein DDL [Vitis vinifera]|uniref:FHA domain-containing protein DDL n=1 Tax=Vitis vinifera TaxID=29760 RepID=A0A438JHU9_VITVI|nr:FHA domain-containing protein DDL [Vitis vinifera]
MVVRTENGLGTGKRVQKEKFLGRKPRGGQRRTMLVGNFPDQGVSESGLFLQQFIIIGADTVRTHLLEMQRMGYDEGTNSRGAKQQRDDDSIAKMNAAEEAIEEKQKQKPSFELSGKLASETNRVRGEAQNSDEKNFTLSFLWGT